MNNDNKNSIKQQTLIALVFTLIILMINSLIHQYQYCKMISPEIPLSESPYSHWILDNLTNSYLGVFTYPVLWIFITLLLFYNKKLWNGLKFLCNRIKKAIIDAFGIVYDEEDVE